uniref:Uncharacterized protein n=1 Tax=Acrobeloides nanus TaxID=290746 RepID=A0A914D9A5_9BILA
MRPVDVSYENVEKLRPSLYDDTAHKRKPQYNADDLEEYLKGIGFSRTPKTLIRMKFLKSLKYYQSATP